MQIQKVTQHIVKWLKDYAQNSKTEGFVIGISGGIDSAVVSTLCAQTQLNTLCLEMPIHQHQNQVQRAKKHIHFLKKNYPNVSSYEFDLTHTFDTLSKELPQGKNDALALANVRSRLRMTTLYYFAGQKNYLVVGTGNKIEDFGVGFFTKYGDGGVDISPIADLLKSQVYLLGEYLGIYPEILQAPPTDGLFGDDRTDEQQIGATYDELEWAMAQYNAGKLADDFKNREQQVFQIYKKLHESNKHKMIPIAVCKIPKVYQ